MKLWSRSLGHLEGGPKPEQQPQKPECAPLSSSPASGRGMEAAPRLSHSVVPSEQRQRLRCGGGCYRWPKAEKRRREVPRGRMQGAGLASVTSGRLRRSLPSFLLPLSSSPPTHVALATASSFPPRGWGRDLAMLCRSPAGRHGSRRRWRVLRENARARGLQPPNRRARGSCKRRGGNVLQAIATKAMLSTALSGRGLFVTISNSADVAFDKPSARPACKAPERRWGRRLSSESYSLEERPRRQYLLLQRQPPREIFHPCASVRAFTTDLMQSLETRTVKPG